jgi:hypothetical protein
LFKQLIADKNIRQSSRNLEDTHAQNASVDVETSAPTIRAELSARKASESEEGQGQSLHQNDVDVKPRIGKPEDIRAQLNGRVDEDGAHEPENITMSALTETETETQISKRRDAVDNGLGYFVSPIETNNKDENDKTEQFLKSLVGATVLGPTIFQGVLQHWMVYNSKSCPGRVVFLISRHCCCEIIYLPQVVTAAQIEEVTKYPGVESVDQDIAYEPSSF